MSRQAYPDRIENLAEQHNDRALAFLRRIAEHITNEGIPVMQAAPMWDDNFRWGFATTDDDEQVGEGSVDFMLELLEQRDFDGADAEPGVNWALTVSLWGGQVLAAYQPFAYTEKCWVDAYDDDAVKQRFALIEGMDVRKMAAHATERQGD